MSNATELLSDLAIRTVGCVFNDRQGATKYTYCTRQTNLAVGDLVMVKVTDGYKIVRVAEVHNTPQLDPEAKFDYRFVLSAPIVELDPMTNA
jgi:hypothetical protein